MMQDISNDQIRRSGSNLCGLCSTLWGGWEGGNGGPKMSERPLKPNTSHLRTSHQEHHRPAYPQPRLSPAPHFTTTNTASHHEPIQPRPICRFKMCANSHSPLSEPLHDDCTHHDDSGATHHKPVQRVLHDTLRLSVQSRGGLGRSEQGLWLSTERDGTGQTCVWSGGGLRRAVQGLGIGTGGTTT